MDDDGVRGLLNPCGLNYDWCVYLRRGERPGCGGCVTRTDCAIGSCLNSEGGCESCASFPCHDFLQGYHCMKQFQTY
jgi:hypothetical protein